FPDRSGHLLQHRPRNRRGGVLPALFKPSLQLSRQLMIGKRGVLVYQGCQQFGSDLRSFGLGQCKSRLKDRLAFRVHKFPAIPPSHSGDGGIAGPPLARENEKENRRVSRRGRANDRKMATCGRAGPPKGWARILSSGLRGRLRSRRIVGLGAASNGPDWRSIRDVLSVARFASALVSRHQSPLVNAYVVIALAQSVAFRRRSLTIASLWVAASHPFQRSRSPSESRGRKSVERSHPRSRSPGR